MVHMGRRFKVVCYLFAQVNTLDSNSSTSTVTCHFTSSRIQLYLKVAKCNGLPFNSAIIHTFSAEYGNLLT